MKESSKQGVGLLKRNSRARITLCLRTHGPLSKAQIATITGLSIGCVSQTCADLLEEKVIVESGTITGLRGRPVVLLTINPNGAPAVGVRIAPESTEIAIATPTFNILARRIIGHSGFGHDVESAVDAIADGIARCARMADVSLNALAGVGVAVHGLVDPVLGIIEEMTNRRGWENVPIVRMLEERLGLPVVADNCVRAGAITYQWFGSERREGGTLFLAIAEGVGAALLYDQEIVRGIHHSGNQLGHTIIDPDGPECPCGKRGCLEAFTSDLSLIRRLWPEAAKRAADMTVEEREGLVRRAYELAESGDAGARAALDDMVTYIGMGIANGIALFGPRTVVVVGTLIDLAPTSVISETRKATLRYVCQRDLGVEIRAAIDYKSFLLRGAIGLVLCHPYRVMQEHSLSLGGLQTHTAAGRHRTR